jgi:uncharacterized protein YhaN
MHFTQLRIDDFGCFRNARLEDLSDGLVVVGGPQRAGKSTFMMAIRQLRSGVSRGGDVPPATDEYRIDGEMVHDGHSYRYVLNGHASPSISSLGGGPDLSVDDVFGPVTEEQYRNLFTISLDELQRLPPGIDDTEDLAQVLLGAAYGDVAEIPEIEGKFRSQADDIGLQRGDPGSKTGQLYDPHRRIQEGLKARREANQQVDQHEQVTEKLETKRSELSDIKGQIEDLREEKSRLNVLSELFETVVEIDELETTLEGVDVAEAKGFPTHRTERLEELREEYETVVGNLHDGKREFDRSVSTTDSERYRGWLLDHEVEIEGFGESRKMWENQVATLTDTENQLAEERHRIESRIAKLHPDWEASFDHVDAVETSDVSTGRVQSLAENIQSLRDDLEDEREKCQRKRSKLADLREQRDGMSENEPGSQEVTVPKRKPAAVAAAGILVGTVMATFVSPFAGGAVGLVIIAVGMYAIDTSVSVEPSIDVEPRRELNSQISNLDSEIASHEARIEELEPKLEAKQEDLQTIADRLGLPDDLSADDVSSLYASVVELDDSIREYRSSYSDWQSNREELVEDLGRVASVFDDGSDVSWDREDPLQTADSPLSQLAAATQDLEKARELRETEGKRDECLEQINDILAEADDVDSLDEAAAPETVDRRVEDFSTAASSAEEIVDASERYDTLVSQVESRFGNPSTRAVFEPVREDEEPWVDVLRRLTDEYADVSAVDSEIRSLEGDIEKRESKQEGLEEACRELKRERDALASEDDLRAAEETINEGRVEFERVGEAYAVNRIAEKLLGDVHERFMAKVVDSLVDDASAIFSEITREYDGIELGGDLQDLEFRATRPDRQDHGVGELSRATAEQLFLAVRLARIRQTEVSLPVVIDDATTNFDPNHAARVFDVIGELTETNQVFFLTCHPDFVDLVSSNGTASQCWGIDSGRFQGMESAEALRQWLGDGATVR